MRARSLAPVPRAPNSKTKRALKSATGIRRTPTPAPRLVMGDRSFTLSSRRTSSPSSPPRPSACTCKLWPGKEEKGGGETAKVSGSHKNQSDESDALSRAPMRIFRDTGTTGLAACSRLTHLGSIHVEETEAGRGRRLFAAVGSRGRSRVHQELVLIGVRPELVGVAADEDVHV